MRHEAQLGNQVQVERRSLARPTGQMKEHTRSWTKFLQIREISQARGVRWPRSSAPILSTCSSPERPHRASCDVHRMGGLLQWRRRSCGRQRGSCRSVSLALVCLAADAEPGLTGQTTGQTDTPKRVSLSVRVVCPKTVAGHFHFVRACPACPASHTLSLQMPIKPRSLSRTLARQMLFAWCPGCRCGPCKSARARA